MVSFQEREPLRGWWGLLVTVLVVAVVLGVVLWRPRAAGPEELPDTICWGLSVERIEALTGYRVTMTGYPQSTPPPLPEPLYRDLDCQITLEGFGEVRFGYADKREFRSVSATHVSEERLTTEWARDGTLERVDLGLDGSTYLLTYPRKDPLEAVAVWYSDSGRTLSLAAFLLDAPTHEGMRAVLVPLLYYAAQVYPQAFPPRPTPTPQATATP